MLGMKSLAFILLLSTTICSQATPGNGFRINPILEGLFPEGELLSEQDTRFRMVKRGCTPSGFLGSWATLGGRDSWAAHQRRMRNKTPGGGCALGCAIRRPLEMRKRKPRFTQPRGD